MNLKNRQQLLGAIAIAALAVLVGDRLILTPLVASWKQRSARIAELRESVLQGTMLLDREAAIRERWAMMRTNTLAREISRAESQVLEAFDRWSRESGVSISAIRPQRKPAADDYLVLECRAEAAGSLASLTRFLYLIEKDPLALKVDALELATRDNEAQQLTLGLQVSGLVLTTPDA